MKIEKIEYDFTKICNICLNNDELVNEFCRLKNIKRPDKLSPIERYIDEICGFDAEREFIKQFIAFVREYICILI